MSSELFQPGDIVWAKMKGYPPWPSKIAKPLSDAKPPKTKKAHFVYFFGAKNYAWIPEDNIVKHSETILSKMNKKKSGPYQQAIDELLNSYQEVVQSAAKVVKATGSIKDKNIVGKEKGIVPKKKKEVACKKEKDIPKMEKAKESSLRKSVKGAKISQTKVVPPNVRNNSKKRGKKLLTTHSSKSSVTVSRKRPLDITFKEEPIECTSPKNQKLVLNEDPLVGGGNAHDFYNFGIDDVSEDSVSLSLSDSFTDDPEHYSIDLQGRHVSPTRKKIGFIGLGNIGKAVVHNLLRSGHHVTVWNKSFYKCDAFVDIGARKAQSPAELMVLCDIIFCSVSDPDASKEVIFGERGILKGLEQVEKLDRPTKGYVEMTSIDPDTSKEIDEVISRNGAKYLEAPLYGNTENATDGTLLIIASGARHLFLECETCFHAMGEHAYFISCDVGFGCQMSLLLSMFSGTVYAAVAETLSLAKRLGLDEDKFLALLGVGPLQCQNLIENIRRMVKEDFKTVTPLKHIQNIINLTLLAGNQLSQPMSVTAAANEVYKHARLLQYSDFDVSAVYQGVVHH